MTKNRQQGAGSRHQTPAAEGPFGHITPALRDRIIAVKELTADSDNVRVHSQRNIDAIRHSLEKFGQQAPVVYAVRNGRRIILKGNGLFTAAKQLGWKYIAAVESGLQGSDARAFAVADNRCSDLSEFDEALLAEQLQELEENEIPLEAMGFNDEELDRLLETVEEPKGRLINPDGRRGRKRGERVVKITIGKFTFDVERSAFDQWMRNVEKQAGSDDADRVIHTLKKRLKLS